MLKGEAVDRRLLAAFQARRPPRSRPTWPPAPRRPGPASTRCPPWTMKPSWPRSWPSRGPCSTTRGGWRWRKRRLPGLPPRQTRAGCGRTPRRRSAGRSLAAPTTGHGRAWPHRPPPISTACAPPTQTSPPPSASPGGCSGRRTPSWPRRQLRPRATGSRSRATSPSAWTGAASTRGRARPCSGWPPPRARRPTTLTTTARTGVSRPTTGASRGRAVRLVGRPPMPPGTLLFRPAHRPHPRLLPHLGDAAGCDTGIMGRFRPGRPSPGRSWRRRGCGTSTGWPTPSSPLATLRSPWPAGRARRGGALHGAGPLRGEAGPGAERVAGGGHRARGGGGR